MNTLNISDRLLKILANLAASELGNYTESLDSWSKIVKDLDQKLDNGEHINDAYYKMCKAQKHDALADVHELMNFVALSMPKPAPLGQSKKEVAPAH